MDNEAPATRPERQQKSPRLGVFMSGMIAGIIFLILVNCAAGYFLPGSLPPLGRPTQAPGQSADSPLTPVQDKLTKIFDVLDRNYVNEYDKDRVIENMYQGLVYGVGDPYTTYMDKDSYGRFQESTEGTYAGIGVVVSPDEATNSIVVVVPFEGYPGEKAGILPGDKIIRVNGYDVFGDTLDEAVSMMKGEPGTSVKITVSRETEGVAAPMEFNIIREKIDVPTVSHKMLEGGIGYIRITQFDRVTFSQFKSAFDSLNADGAKGLIIDLRNNPGGLLNIVTSITDLLVPKKSVIVYTEDKQGKREYTYSREGSKDIPLIVLVNGSSASASEVLSGAVKDLGAGELLGTRTFGKGLVQNIFELKDGSALKVTIAKYYTPSGTCIQGIGIEPDYVVEMSDELSVRISSLSLDEDVQLKRALEIMEEKTAD